MQNIRDMATCNGYNAFAVRRGEALTSTMCDRFQVRPTAWRKKLFGSTLLIKEYATPPVLQCPSCRVHVATATACPAAVPRCRCLADNAVHWLHHLSVKAVLHDGTLSTSAVHTAHTGPQGKLH